MPLNRQKKLKGPAVKIDKRLDNLAEQNLFPEKLEIANRMLEGVELPKRRKTAVKTKVVASQASTRIRT